MKGWRTLLINVAIALFGVLEAADWTTLLGNDHAAWVVTTIALINIALRTLTTTEVGRSS